MFSGKKMLIMLLVFSMIGCTVPTVVLAENGNTTATFQGHIYERIDMGMTWKEATLYCESMGGHLATITSAEEQAVVQNLVAGGAKAQYWLGGTDEQKEGEWKWITGEDWSFWNSTVTFDNYNNNEHYLQMQRHHWGDENYLGVWNDINNENYIAGQDSFFVTANTGLICEWDNPMNPDAKTINELMASGMWQQKGGSQFILKFKVNGNQVTGQYYASDGKYIGEYTGTISGNVCNGYWKRMKGSTEISGKKVFKYENGVFRATSYKDKGSFDYETELLPYTGSVDSSPDFAVTGANLLKNPSFEDGLQNWVNPTGDWVFAPKADNDDFYKAVHGTNLIWAEHSKSKDTYIYQDVPLNGLPVGKELKLSVQTSNWPQSPRDRSKIVLNFLDASGNILKTCSNENEGDTWYKLDVSGAIPAGAVTVRVELWAIYHNGVIVDAYYDDIVLTAGGASNNNNNNNNNNNYNNNNNNSGLTPTPDNALSVPLTGGKGLGTTSVFNGVTGVTVNFENFGALGCRLFRSTNPTDPGISVTDFYITSKNFTDVNVEPNTTYYYTLREVLAEADPLNNKREVLGDVIATWTVTTAGTVGQNFSNPAKTRHFIMLKIDDPYMSVDGIVQEVDPGKGTKPIVISGRTMVPIRAIVESMGGFVSWQPADYQVGILVNGVDLKMWVGKKELSKNNVKINIDVAPTALNERTFVPLRFCAENLNCQVDWINSTRSIVIVWSE